MESEPHNHKNFVCLADDKTHEQVPFNKQKSKRPKDQGDELVEVNLADGDGEPRLLFLSANLLTELRQAILTLLREIRDVFA